jgi:hypothetical protein
MEVLPHRSQGITEVRVMNFLRDSSWLVVVRDAVGLLAVVAVLALTSPGVQIARAGDEVAVAPPASAALISVDPALVGRKTPAAASATSPSCSKPTTPTILNDAMVEQQRRRLMQEISRRAAAQQPGQAPQDGVVLNSRGYNYRPTQVR